MKKNTFSLHSLYVANKKVGVGANQFIVNIAAKEFTLSK
jgi:hypothetical protein